MGLIKQIGVYQGGNNWDYHDIGVDASNVLIDIQGIEADNLNVALLQIKNSIPSSINTLSVSSGGTGRSTLASNAILAGDGTNAVKTIASNNGALYATSANGIPTWGTLPAAQGGTGRTSIANIRANLASTTAANPLAGNIGVTGTLPVANGGTGRTSITNIRANLESTTAANALAGNIGVTGTLPIARGGTGTTTKRGYLDWTSLATTTGETQKKFTLPSNYSELLVTCLYPSNGSKYAGSVVIPRHLINATKRQWYLGGGRSGKTVDSMSGRRTCCWLTSTYIDPIKLNVDGSEVNGNWTVYYR